MRILFLRKMKKIYAKGAAPSREHAAPSAHPLWARLENKVLTSDCNRAMIWCLLFHMKTSQSYPLYDARIPSSKSLLILA